MHFLAERVSPLPPPPLSGRFRFKSFFYWGAPVHFSHLEFSSSFVLYKFLFMNSNSVFMEKSWSLFSSYKHLFHHFFIWYICYR